MSQTISTILAAAEHAAGATSEEHAAAEGHHKSEAPFFIAGAILVSFAILISVVGFKKPEFPGNAAAARGVMALSALLVAATLSSAIYVAI